MCTFVMKASFFADRDQSTRSKKGTWELVEPRTASVSVGTRGWSTCGLAAAFGRFRTYSEVQNI